MKSRGRRGFKLPRSLHVTRAGWCFIAIVLGVGFAALNTGNNLLYLVLALLLAFLVLSGLLSEMSLRGVRVERRLPQELFAGTPSRVSIRVRNAQQRSPALALVVEDRIEVDDELVSAGRTFLLRVAAQDAAERSYVFEPPRRGELLFRGFRVSTRFPFGLFVKSVDIDLDAKALVYPKLVDVPQVAEAAASELEGTISRERTLEGDQIGGLREYVRGDSIHRVHWRRSLRERQLIVGEREGAARAEIEVLFAPAPRLSREQYESRVSRAASEVVELLATGYRVGLRCPDRHFAPEAGFAHRAMLLTHLARVQREASTARSEASSEKRVPTAARADGAA